MATETKLPTGIQSSANYSTLNLGDIDEDPSSPDGNFGTWDGNGNTSCVVDYDTPTGPPTVGAGLQTFRCQAKKNASAGQDTTYSLELWENGSLVSVLSTGTITSTTGQVVSGTWNASSLGTADGSLVQCALVQTGGGLGGSRRGIEVGAFAWDVTYNVVTTNSINKTSDARIKATGSVSKNADARIKATGSVSKNADARVLVIGELSKTSDGRILVQNNLALVSDARILGTLSENILSDARILGTFEIQKTSDATVQVVTTNEIQKTGDARILGTVSIVKTADGRILIVQSIGKTSDATIEGSGITTNSINKTSDARIKSTGQIEKTSGASVGYSGEFVEVSRRRGGGGSPGRVSQRKQRQSIKIRSKARIVHANTIEIRSGSRVLTENRIWITAGATIKNSGRIVLASATRVRSTGTIVIGAGARVMEGDDVIFAAAAFLFDGGGSELTLTNEKKGT